MLPQQEQAWMEPGTILCDLMTGWRSFWLVCFVGGAIIER